jgi:tetraacyldisaccharide 4'-kinase
VEFIRRLRDVLPQTRIFVSTSTLTGREVAGKTLEGLAEGIFYIPSDYAFAVRRVLRTLRPSVVLVAETEIWPNLFREAKRTRASLALVNGRISDRAFERYRRQRWFFGPVLAQADAILAQSDEIARRFVAIGAPADRVRTAGNFKYDFEARTPDPQSPVLAWIARIEPARVWIAASTTFEGGVDEDDAVLAAWQELRRRYPDLALILAPRKPERFGPVAAKLDAAGIVYWRRSADATDARVLLLDTMGELAGLFSIADVVFMGGTLSIRGGHNVLEPALFGRPVIVGPRMENFQAIADEFHAAGAYVEIEDGQVLAEAVSRLLENRAEAEEIGRRAMACAAASRGASARTAAAVRELYAERIPRYRPALPWYPLARVLALAWRWGGKLKQEADLRAQKKLDLPVISVGNLAMGGTGKTPCVLRLAELLRDSGHRPGILTRGYKRHTPHDQLVLAPGAAVSAAQSGDEPQIFIRSELAPVGIGADRWRCGMLLRRHFDVDVMLLDDGFQHLKVARNLDIVLLDALNPFAGGVVFPVGRLREPASALARADIIVITRASDSDLACAVEHALKQWNPEAPVFRAWVEPREWVENRSGRRFPVAERPFGPAGVFCGLGNPLTFRHTLSGLGVEPLAWVDFEDHHRYRPNELRRTAHLLEAARAEAAVTTEKDAVNLCDGCDDLMSPLPIYWLRIGMKVEREEEFLAAVSEALKKDAVS